jgi:hypothetical protein
MTFRAVWAALLMFARIRKRPDPVLNNAFAPWQGCGGCRFQHGAWSFSARLDREDDLAPQPARFEFLVGFGNLRE